MFSWLILKKVQHLPQFLGVFVCRQNCDEKLRPGYKKFAGPSEKETYSLEKKSIVVQEKQSVTF